MCDSWENSGFEKYEPWHTAKEVIAKFESGQPDELSKAQERVKELEAALYQKEMEFTQLLAEFKDKP